MKGFSSLICRDLIHLVNRIAGQIAQRRIPPIMPTEPFILTVRRISMSFSLFITSLDSLLLSASKKGREFNSTLSLAHLRRCIDALIKEGFANGKTGIETPSYIVPTDKFIARLRKHGITGKDVGSSIVKDSALPKKKRKKKKAKGKHSSRKGV